MAEAKKPAKTTKKKPVEESDAKNEENDVIETSEPIVAAKAGKRSGKAVAEAEEKAVKEERKKAPKEEAVSEKPKIQQKPPRSREERAGKKYREAAKHLEKGKTYNLAEATDLASRTSTTNFDATVEMHINLAVDPKQADQNVRGVVALPNGSGKTSKVAVFAEGDDIAKAKAAGAEFVGSEEILAALDKEQIEFDTLISSPTLMPRLGKYAKFLGPRGLMPNPKSGTVTTDVAKAVKEAKAGKVEYRVDQSGIIHLGIGKVSFGPKKLLENAQVVASSVRAAKPASIKGVYIRSTYLTTTMGPSIKADL